MPGPPLEPGFVAPLPFVRGAVPAAGRLHGWERLSAGPGAGLRALLVRRSTTAALGALWPKRTAHARPPASGQVGRVGRGGQGDLLYARAPARL